jgi:hypothetical protein
MYSFPLCISCIWHGTCNMMYRHLCILDCMHFVSYALVRKGFSYIHCSPWNAIYVFEGPKRRTIEGGGVNGSR